MKSIDTCNSFQLMLLCTIPEEIVRMSYFSMLYSVWVDIWKLFCVFYIIMDAVEAEDKEGNVGAALVIGAFGTIVIFMILLHCCLNWKVRENINSNDT